MLLRFVWSKLLPIFPPEILYITALQQKTQYITVITWVLMQYSQSVPCSLSVVSGLVQLCGLGVFCDLLLSRFVQRVHTNMEVKGENWWPHPVLWELDMFTASQCMLTFLQVKEKRRRRLPTPAVITLNTFVVLGLRGLERKFVCLQTRPRAHLHMWRRWSYSGPQAQITNTNRKKKTNAHNKTHKCFAFSVLCCVLRFCHCVFHVRAILVSWLSFAICGCVLRFIISGCVLSFVVLCTSEPFVFEFHNLLLCSVEKTVCLGLANKWRKWFRVKPPGISVWRLQKHFKGSVISRA